MSDVRLVPFDAPQCNHLQLHAKCTTTRPKTCALQPYCSHFVYYSVYGKARACAVLGRPRAHPFRVGR
eukprot:6059226-Amphidinium_carterae.1